MALFFFEKNKYFPSLKGQEVDSQSLLTPPEARANIFSKFAVLLK
jgi:hypothetical protein